MFDSLLVAGIAVSVVVTAVVAAAYIKCRFCGGEK
jgi:hypothetical protein